MVPFETHPGVMNHGRFLRKRTKNNNKNNYIYQVNLSLYHEKPKKKSTITEQRWQRVHFPRIHYQRQMVIAELQTAVVRLSFKQHPFAFFTDFRPECITGKMYCRHLSEIVG